ncbi:hypothetical protein [Janthinobacterium sp.]|uniref:hypothetical protein n=1 Tax=Janthinobacterium sp. TaxID=1871054 RepID=UPI00260970D4|nr:hypothetical protein [Janthinobacterium sp.]
MNETEARSDLDVLRLALQDMAGVVYGTTAVYVDEMLLGLQKLVTNGSRDDLAILAGSIATFLGQPQALCEPPNIRFRKLSSTLKNSMVSTSP